MTSIVAWYNNNNNNNNDNNNNNNNNNQKCTLFQTKLVSASTITWAPLKSRYNIGLFYQLW